MSDAAGASSPRAGNSACKVSPAQREWLHPRARGELAAETVRQAAVIVAHVLHTPMTALDEADVEDVLEWADDAAALTRALSR